MTPPCGIANQRRRQVVGQPKIQEQRVLRGARRVKFDDVTHHFVRIERDRSDVHPNRLELRVVEDVVDDRVQRVDRPRHEFDPSLLLCVEWTLHQQLREAHDAVDGCADLVAHVREEPALHTARLLGSLLRNEQQRAFSSRSRSCALCNAITAAAASSSTSSTAATPNTLTRAVLLALIQSRAA